MANLLAVASMRDIDYQQSNKDTPLIEACDKGHIEIVRMLVKAGADVRMRGCYTTALRKACSSGHLDILKVLLTTEAKQDVKDDNLALELACKYGHAAVVELLMDAGTGKKGNKYENNRAFVGAAERGHVDVIRVLLACPAFRAEMGALNRDGRTVRSLALWAGHTDVVKLLDAYENAQSKDGDYELLLAVENGRTSAVEHLLGVGADKDARKKDGDSAGTLGVLGGYVDVVKLFIGVVAGRSAVNQNGDTALILAVKAGHAGAVKVLADAGADTNAMNQDGETALTLAVKDRQEGFIQLLLDAGARLPSVHSQILTKMALKVSAEGRLPALQQLMNAGADLSAKNKVGFTPLMAAAENGHAKVVRLLLSVDAVLASRDAEDRDDCTALNLAIKNGHAEVVKLLVNAGAKKGLQNEDLIWQLTNEGRADFLKVLVECGASIPTGEQNDRTLVMMASEKGDAAVLGVLLTIRALHSGRDAQNKGGNTAILLAVKNNHAEVVQLLLDAGADIYIKNKKGRTAHSAASSKEMKSLLSYVDTIEYACTQIHKQVAEVSYTSDALQRLEAAQAQYDAAEAAGEGVERMVSLGKTLDALQQECAQLPLSQKDYLTLPSRHAQLVQRVEERCKQLKKAKDYAGLEKMGALLEALKPLKLPDVPTAASDSGKSLFKGPLRGFLGLGASKASVQVAHVDVGSLFSMVAEQNTACDSLATQVSQAPQRAEMIQRLEAAQAQYDAAEAACTNLSDVASLAQAVAALQQESAQLPLSEEDYLTLPARHAKLVQRVNLSCEDLRKAKQFDLLAKLSGQLQRLRTLEIPAAVTAKGQVRLPPSKAVLDQLLSDCAELGSVCNLLTKQASQAPQRAQMIQRLEAAQAQYNAAVAARTDLSLIASLGNALVALQLESAQLPLSEEDYLTLPARHAQLVPKALRACRDLMKTAQFEDLAGLSDKLKALGELAVPTVTGSSRVPAPALSRSAVDRLVKSSAELSASFDAHIQQVALAAQRSSVTQRLEAVQAQYAAVEAAGDFRSVGVLGKTLEDLKAGSDKISLTQKDYLTLADRHALLVQRVVSKCQELAKAGKKSELAMLVNKMDTLKSLDLSALPQLTRAKASPPTRPPVPPKEATTTADAAGGEEDQSTATERPHVDDLEKDIAATSSDANTTKLSPTKAPDAVQEPVNAEEKSEKVAQQPEKNPQPQPFTELDQNFPHAPDSSSKSLLPSLRESRSSSLSDDFFDTLSLEDGTVAQLAALDGTVPVSLGNPPAGIDRQAGNTAGPALSIASAAAAAAAFTHQERGALNAFLQDSAALLRSNADLQQVMRTVAAHDRTLQMLVSKEKECPSLFWFYPKKPELRRWLSDPAKCLFQDTLMMVVVCPVTLCVVECGPEGVGWEVTKPKEWVKKWGPAILFSIYVMQAAVVAGRVVGIPLPPVPGAADVRKALGLKGMLGGMVSRGLEEMDPGGSLAAFQEVTIAELEQTVESQALVDGLSGSGAGDPGAPLPADLPMHMVGEAYKSIHTFLTTGENAELGELEDQLRGRMERVMAPDGDVEWVSVQGRDAWLEKHVAAASMKAAAGVQTTDIPVTSLLLYQPPQPSMPSAPTGPPTWLGEKLTAAGVGPELVQLCDRVLVREQGFGSEKRLARTPTTKFHEVFLTGVGITSVGLQLELLDLHRELRQTDSASARGTPPPSMMKAPSTKFTSEDRQLLRQLKLLQRAPEPTAMYTVDRGNQMQLTASAFSQQGPQGAQDQQQQLARRIAELEARLAETQGAVGDHITETALRLENMEGRPDPHLQPPSTDTGAGADVAQEGCCRVS